jgi:hypothetical protein
MKKEDRGFESRQGVRGYEYTYAYITTLLLVTWKRNAIVNLGGKINDKKICPGGVV